MALSLRTLNSFPPKKEGRMQVENYEDGLDRVCLSHYHQVSTCLQKESAFNFVNILPSF